MKQPKVGLIVGLVEHYGSHHAESVIEKKSELESVKSRISNFTARRIGRGCRNHRARLCRFTGCRTYRLNTFRGGAREVFDFNEQRCAALPIEAPNDAVGFKVFGARRSHFKLNAYPRQFPSNKS
jgi:hypothetical protein